MNTNNTGAIENVIYYVLGDGGRDKAYTGPDSPADGQIKIHRYFFVTRLGFPNPAEHAIA